MLDGGGIEIATDVTEGDGDYGFGDLQPGTYTVVVDGTTLPDGFLQTFDIEGAQDDDSATVTLGAGENRDDVDFGYADECLTDLDFETNAAGVALKAGDLVENQWAKFGVTVTTDSPIVHPAMIFDSANPTGGDDDLGTPNEDFGGPGIGSGGRAGVAGENAVPLGKVLIISEDGDVTDPDDDAKGGTLIFDFAHPVRVTSVGILDIDEGNAGTVSVFDAGGAMIGSVGMADNLGNNSVQTVAVGASGVSRMEIFFPGSGAVTGIVFCSDCTPLMVRDDFDSASFSNNDGPNSWESGWLENDPEAGGAGPSAGQVRVADGFLRLDDYPNTGGQPSVARTVDLSGATNATLKFDFDTSSGVDYDDAVTVEISSNGGSTYTTLEVITGISGETWQDRTFDITSFISSETTVRFRVSNKYGGSNEFFFSNFVKIESGCGDCVAVQVRDDFEVKSFGNNDGSSNWSDDWIENDTQAGGAGPSAGQVQIHHGLLTLDDYPNTGGQPSLAREVDLSGVSNASLRFEFITSSGVDYSDAVTAEVSSDGGATWTTLEVITNIVGYFEDTREFDISAFASAQTQVRFRVSNKYGGSNELFCLTFIEIVSSCSSGAAPSDSEEADSPSPTGLIARQ